MAIVKKAAKPAAKAEKKVAKKRAGVCLFSGEPTSGGNFRPGYDAKMKSLLLSVVRGDKKLSDIPPAALPFLKRTEGLVGFRLNGKALEVIGNFSAAPKKAPKIKTKDTAKASIKASKKAVAAVAEDDEDEIFDEDE